MRYKLNTPEHADIVAKIRDMAHSADVDVSITSSYSGRCMYGQLCYGVESDDETSLLMAIGAAGLPRPKMDSMGRGVIAYWPEIEGDSGLDDSGETTSNMETSAIEKPLFGLVCFEEPGTPWTRVQGKYELIKQDDGELWGGEPHWEIKLEKGDTCFVPISSVVVLPNT